MKCLHCGNETDRFSKWRGTSEFCSDACKKAFTEESDKLAMRRLMQPKKAVTVQRANVARVSGNKTVDAGSAVAVEEVKAPAGESPRVEEPPAAAFIAESPAVLSILQLRTQPPTSPRPMDPLIPDSGLNWTEDLLELADSLLPAHPQPRGERPWPAGWITGFAAVPGVPHSVDPDIWVEPVWADRLGLWLQVGGLELPGSPVMPAETRATAPASGAGLLAEASAKAERQDAAAPVSHKGIPAKRPRLAYAVVIDHHIAAEAPVPEPTVTAPRLRIHLPKPVLLPLRPKFAFAPKPKEETKNEPEKPKDSAAQIAAKRVLEQKEREAKAKAAKSEPAKPLAAPEANAPEPKAPEVKPKVEAKVEPKPQPKVEAKEAPKAETKPAPKKIEPKAELKAEPKAEVKVEAKAEPAPARKPEPEKVEKPASVAAPSFGVPEGEEDSGGKKKLLIAAAAVIACGLGYYFLRPASASAGVTLPRSAPSASAISMGADSWLTDWAGDATGSARGRQLTIYKPAKGKKDYIFEFSASPEQHAIGWVFRAKDNRNYYCMKLEWNGEGSARRAQIVKFAVVNGEEQPHRIVDLRQPIDFSKPARVIMDIRGANFSTQINGVPADSWIDSQIADGTVGFSNERNERAVVRTVKVSY